MSVLENILSGVRADLERRQSETPLAELQMRVADATPPIDPLPDFRAPGISIIAEVKRRSPSKGALADIADPASLADQYAADGATAISVLTEQRRFGGSLADLDAVRTRVGIPVLQKDFVIDPYQLWEGRAHGADLALLMVVSLSDRKLSKLMALCEELGLTALVEAHTAEEVGRAVDAGAKLLGINARDLTTLHVDRTVFADLVSLVPEGVVRVAESGVSRPSDVAEYFAWGADVVLVGEALVRSGNPSTAVAELIHSVNAHTDQATQP